MFTSRRCRSLGSSSCLRTQVKKSNSCRKCLPVLERDKYWEDYERVSKEYAHCLQKVHLPSLRRLINDLAQTTVCEYNLGKIESKTKRIYKYLSKMTQKRIMLPYLMSTIGQVQTKRAQIHKENFPSVRTKLRDQIQTKFKKLDQSILKTIQKPLPNISYNVRMYKECVPTFGVTETPARINNTQLKQKPQTPPKRCSSLQRLDIRPPKHFYKHMDIISYQLHYLYNYISVEHKLLCKVIEMTEDLRSTDQFYQKIHHKATTKRKQLKVLCDCISKKTEEANDVYSMKTKVVNIDYYSLILLRKNIQRSNINYAKQLANETKAGVEY